MKNKNKQVTYLSIKVVGLYVVYCLCYATIINIHLYLNLLMKLQEIQTKTNKVYFVTLPIALVKAKSWQKGQQIEAKLNREGNIVLTEKQAVTADLQQ